MKTLFIVMDSLNRHYLNCYGADWIQTPNLDRLAARGMVFDNHWSGSLPCMPARREMMTGRYNFLEAPWGSIELFDDCLPTQLDQKAGVYSHLITDHYHYFHAGGDGYHDLFSSWEFERGQEGDKWRPLVDAPGAPEGARGKGVARGAYWRNREFIDPEDDLSYPTPRCFERAVDFIEHNHAADKWHLHLEVFDPHEPFDCPKKYRDLYKDTWDKYWYTWPNYDRLDPEADDAEAVAHIRKCYAGALTMADAWLGKLLDKLDEHDVWKDTVVVLSTDHGHLLGEHGYWAKNYMMDYAELAHIPMIVCAPGVEAGRRCQALTTTIDLMPTFMELHGAELPPHVHGKSIAHLLQREEPHHDAILYGYFGKDVNLTDGRYTYCRQPLPGSTVHWHTCNPKGFGWGNSRESWAKAEVGHFLPQGYDLPQMRVERPCGRHKDAPDFNPIYDLSADPGQTNPVRDDALEAKLAAKMKELLQRYEAPPCHYTRLGLED